MSDLLYLKDFLNEKKSIQSDFEKLSSSNVNSEKSEKDSPNKSNDDLREF